MNKLEISFETSSTNPSGEDAILLLCVDSQKTGYLLKSGCPIKSAKCTNLDWNQTSQFC